MAESTTPPSSGTKLRDSVLVKSNKRVITSDAGENEKLKASSKPEKVKSVKEPKEKVDKSLSIKKKENEKLAKTLGQSAKGSGGGSKMERAHSVRVTGKEVKDEGGPNKAQTRRWTELTSRDPFLLTATYKKNAEAQSSAMGMGHAGSEKGAKGEHGSHASGGGRAGYTPAPMDLYAFVFNEHHLLLQTIYWDNKEARGKSTFFLFFFFLSFFLSFFCIVFSPLIG
jgi:hypothetical protein